MYFRKVCKLAIGSIILLRKTSTRNRLCRYAKRPLDLCAPLFQLLFWSISHDGSGVLMPTKNMTYQNGNGLITMKLQKGDCKFWTSFLFRTPWKIEGWKLKKWRWFGPKWFSFPKLAIFSFQPLIFPGLVFPIIKIGVSTKSCLAAEMVRILNTVKAWPLNSGNWHWTSLVAIFQRKKNGSR